MSGDADQIYNFEISSRIAVPIMFSLRMVTAKAAASVSSAPQEKVKSSLPNMHSVSEIVF